jgi:hypothetical protein
MIIRNETCTSKLGLVIESSKNMAKTYEHGHKKKDIRQEYHHQGIYASSDKKHEMNKYYDPRSAKSNQPKYTKIT